MGGEGGEKERERETGGGGEGREREVGGGRADETRRGETRDKTRENERQGNGR